MTDLSDVINDPSYTKVLDHGFVGLVDHMGSDDRIAQAARTSYGPGTKAVRDNKTLIRYLVKHQHTSPLEQCVLTFHIKLPIFVMRQLVRHRTACLTGDNILWFDNSGCVEGDNRKVLPLKPNSFNGKSIKDFYDAWHNGIKQIRKSSSKTHKIDISLIEDNKTYTSKEMSAITGYNPDKIIGFLKTKKIKGSKVSILGGPTGKIEWQFTGKDFKEFVQRNNEKKYSHTYDIKPRLKKMTIRCLNEDTGAIIHTNITDIWKNGEKPVYKVEFENGKNITMTKDHLCYTNIGWLTLANAINLEILPDNSIKQWSDDILFATSGVIKEKNIELKTDGNREKRKALYNDWSKVKKVTYLGNQMTYDLSVEGPYHNFICNGVVVHNSLNELSARYSELPSEFYFPETENIKPQSLTNKQGRAGHFTEEHLEEIDNYLHESCDLSYTYYTNLLDNRDNMIDDSTENYPGLSRELARMVLPVNIYTECYWTINLRNFFHYYNLRADSHAQWEIQQYAKAKLSLISQLFPIATQAAQDYIWESRIQSKMERNLLKNILMNKVSDFSTSYKELVDLYGSEDKIMEIYSMSKREFNEFKEEWNL